MISRYLSLMWFGIGAFFLYWYLTGKASEEEQWILLVSMAVALTMGMWRLWGGRKKR